jgi:hypothetical protein
MAKDCLALDSRVWQNRFIRKNTGVTTEEINNNLLLTTDDKEMTVWQVAAEYGKVKCLLKIWNLAKEKLTK